MCLTAAALVVVVVVVVGGGGGGGEGTALAAVVEKNDQFLPCKDENCYQNTENFFLLTLFI